MFHRRRTPSVGVSHLTCQASTSNRLCRNSIYDKCYKCLCTIRLTTWYTAWNRPGLRIRSSSCYPSLPCSSSLQCEPLICSCSYSAPEPYLVTCAGGRDSDEAYATEAELELIKWKRGETPKPRPGDASPTAEQFRLDDCPNISITLSYSACI